MHQWRMLFQWTVLTLFAVAGIHAQERPAVFLDQNNATKPQTPVKRSVTLAEAVEIFMRQNLELVAARYDIETADAEKLTARLHPNPQLTVGLSDLPVNLSGPFIKEQTYYYGISRTSSWAENDSKRIDAANANSDLARGQFQMVVWQLTNDLKTQFLHVLLNQSLLKLAQENETTFAEIVKHTTELVNAGEISGLDLNASKSKNSSSIPISPTRNGLRARVARSAVRAGWRLSSDGHRGHRHARLRTLRILACGSARQSAGCTS